MTTAELAKRIEHTLLAPEATVEAVDRLCDEAIQFGFGGVCVNPVYVRRVSDRMAAADSGGAGDRPVIVSVAGFPLGASTTATKCDEARRVLDDGATHVDMVVHLGALLAGDRKKVRGEIEALARIVHGGNPGGVLKVILETAVLNPDDIILGCRCCAEGEADFVKTSTGFHPAGGATIEHVRLLRRHAAPLRVKAAGGIRTAAAALALLDAGADRLGTSSGVTIIEQMRSSIP